VIESYRVGGCVRDAILGVKSKDVDCAVEAPSFDAMKEWIVGRGGQIFLEKPEFLTIRAKVGGEAMDFVLCRKDGAYSDARHPDAVEIGTIFDDLGRRDFTMNAIAQRENDKAFIDPFRGADDIAAKLIRTVGSAVDRFSEDALRLLRAMRFSITMGFRLHPDVDFCLYQDFMLRKLPLVSAERRQAELAKCFHADTLATLQFLEDHFLLRDCLFNGSKMWLEPTTKERPAGH
jgi:tRNA nucleotidyltransferase (CCA-adding enzyme)